MEQLRSAQAESKAEAERLAQQEATLKKQIAEEKKQREAISKKHKE